MATDGPSAPPLEFDGSRHAAPDTGLALHYAAMHSRVDEARQLLEIGGAHVVDAVDDQGRTALHFACCSRMDPRSRSTDVLRLLLDAGASVGAKDALGQTPMHTAAQFGDTMAVYILALRGHAPVNARDRDGRAPLHHAAGRGATDAVRVLLAFGADATAPDAGARHPLHYAAMRGHRAAAELLMYGGGAASLDAPDGSGATPAAHARSERHWRAAAHLDEWRERTRVGCCSRGRACFWLVKYQVAPFLAAYIVGMVGFMMWRVVPGPQGSPTPWARLWAGVVCACAGVGLLFMWLTTATDPGFLPRHGAASSAPAVQRRGSVGSSGADVEQPLLPLKDHGRSDSAHGGGGGSSGCYRQLDSPALWAGHWGQLCVSCRIVRPLRAKHCATTERCVETFDHYCPWVGNAVGRRNAHYFAWFLAFELAAIVVSVGLAVAYVRATVSRHGAMTDALTTAVGHGAVVTHRRTSAAMRAAGRRALAAIVGLAEVLVFVVVDASVGIGVAMLLGVHMHHLARNTTTNEAENWERYHYLNTPEGKFTNPFDRGCLSNIEEACTPCRQPPVPVYLAPGERPQADVHWHTSPLAARVQQVVRMQQLVLQGAARAVGQLVQCGRGHHVGRDAATMV